MVPIVSRRQTFQTALVSASATAALLSKPNRALARNLPQSTGADISNTGTLATLIPIVQLRNNVRQWQSDITKNNESASFRRNLPSLPTALPRDETSFKRILDNYSDPVSYKQKFVDQNAFLVYYTKGFDGPGRPSLEDDLPVKQTLQYGARNDAWVAWEEVLSEYDFAQRQQQKGDEWDEEDVFKPLHRVLQALDAYLSLAPNEDLQEAQKQASGSGR